MLYNETPTKGGKMKISILPYLSPTFRSKSYMKLVIKYAIMNLTYGRRYEDRKQYVWSEVSFKKEEYQ